MYIYHQMADWKDIINTNEHRPWPLPAGAWIYYQEWNRALFLHWRVPEELLLPLVPETTTLLLSDEAAWISLVAFTMEKVRPRLLPALPFVSYFHEVNLRTYVTLNNKPGVYFFSMEAEKRVAAWTAKFLSGLPYEHAFIHRHNAASQQEYKVHNKRKAFELDTTFIPGEKIANKSPIDLFLTEKYCLYQQMKNKLYRYEIHHKPWPLQTVKLPHLKTKYQVGNISLETKPHLAHYSNGVQVLGWQRERVL